MDAADSTLKVEKKEKKEKKERRDSGKLSEKAENDIGEVPKLEVEGSDSK